MATKKTWRPFYEVFLERVIKIDAVQCHRAAAANAAGADHFLAKGLEEFFENGYRAEYDIYEFLWRLDAPETFVRPVRREWLSPSPPMLLAWKAVVAAFKDFIKEIRDGEWIASGVHPA